MSSLNSKINVTTLSIYYYIGMCNAAYDNYSYPFYSSEVEALREDRYTAYINHFQVKELLCRVQDEIQQDNHILEILEKSRLELLATLDKHIKLYESIQERFSHEVFLALQISSILRFISTVPRGDFENSSIFLVKKSLELEDKINQLLNNAHTTELDYSLIDKCYQYVIDNYDNQLSNDMVATLNEAYAKLEVARLMIGR